MSGALDPLLAGAAGSRTAQLRFLHALAAAPLILLLEEEAGAGTLRPLIYPLESGPTAVAFDGEDRLAAAIARPTSHATLPGRAIAQAIAPHGASLALNPGAEGFETVLDPETLAWISGVSAAEVTGADAAYRPGPPRDPGAELLEGLAQRVADHGAALGEAWLTGDASGGGDELVLVIRPAGTDDPLLIADLARAGQMLTARPFAVAPAEAGSALLARARRCGIGLLAPEDI